MSTVLLDIVTPDRSVFSGQVSMVIARGGDGDVGILPNHSPLVTTVKTSIVTIRREQGDVRVAVSGGFLEVQPKKISILAEAAELPEEIDAERATRAKTRAEERLREKAENLDYERATRALARALNRLDLANGK